MPIVTGQNADASDFRGLIFPYAGPTAPLGFLLCDGSAVSRITYAGLFALIGSTYGAGDGSTTFNVPDMRGRTIIGVGTGATSVSFDANSGVSTSTDKITVPTNDWLITGQQVTLAGSTLPTGLSAGSYYVIRIDSTHIQLATSLANAQNGTKVDITAVGSGTATLTQTLASRALGDKGGEENHAMSSSELLSHNHAPVTRTSGNTGSSDMAGASGANSTSGSTNSTTYPNGVANLAITPNGGNAAMNNMQPYVALNFIIKT